MKINWRKLNRVIHRDLGYFFFGVTLIYAISGIALNHNEIWNPNYIIKARDFFVEPILKEKINRDLLDSLIKANGENGLKGYYFPKPDLVKAFFKEGQIVVNFVTGETRIEIIRKRPFFNQINFLHYDPGKWWTYFSDIYAIALALMAITGLFIIKGKNGLKWRGLILALAGLSIPIIFLLFFR